MLSTEEKNERYEILFNNLTCSQKDDLNNEIEDSVESVIANGKASIDVYEIACKLFFNKDAEDVTIQELRDLNNEDSESVTSCSQGGFINTAELYGWLSGLNAVKYRDGTKYQFRDNGRLYKDGQRVPRKEQPSFAYSEAWTRA